MQATFFKLKIFNYVYSIGGYARECVHRNGHSFFTTKYKILKTAPELSFFHQTFFIL